MGLIRRVGKSKLLVIGLDGFPYSLLVHLAESGVMPFLGKCFSKAAPRPMTSVLPTVSSVAWATFMTGRNPGHHNIFGFIDRTISPFEMTLTNARSMTAPTLWKTLGNRKIPVIIMNVPVTYPPEPVYGCVVSGFLGVELKRSVYPPKIRPLLESEGYVIDADTSAEAVADKETFIGSLKDVMDRRVASFRRLLHMYPWRFAQLHIMETDRLFHFAWSAAKESSGTIHRRFQDFMRGLDKHLGTLADMLNDGDGLLLLSDHGFQASVTEVQMNTFLIQEGFLSWRRTPPDKLSDMDASSRAYSLIPGRIFLNLKNREPFGSILPGELPGILADLKKALLNLKTPDGRSVCARVVFKETIYDGPQTGNAAELIIDPAPGIELKSSLRKAPLFAPSRLEGCHTFDNAFFWCRGGQMSPAPPNIIDLYPSILSFFRIRDPHAEGKIVIKWNH